MNRFLILSLLLLSFSTIVMSQDKDNDTRWKEVTQLIKETKVVSANELLDEIYLDAKKDSDYDQMIKALITQSQLTRRIEEDHMVKDIYRYEERFNQTNDPVLKALFANIIAKRYHAYLQRNMYQFNGRTQIQNKTEGDILTFSIADLIEESNSYFLISIQDKSALKAIKSYDLKDILIDNESKFIEETDLYLLLSMDVIRHFGASSNLVTEAQNKFVLNQEELFGDASTFIDIDFSNGTLLELDRVDDEAYSRQVVVLYQSLLDEYKKDTGLVHEKINLLRLRFIKQHASILDVGKKYIESLETYYQVQDRVSARELIGEELLKGYMSQLNNNHTELWSDDKKITLSKTIDLIDQQGRSDTKMFKESASLALGLIKKKEFTIKLEKIIPIKGEALSLVTYKNITKLNSRIVKASRQQIQDLQNLINKEKFNKLEKYEAVVEWSDTLPQGDDFMNHSIEIVIPPLRSGTYLLITYDGSSPSNSVVVQGTPLFVSDLAYNYESTKGKHQVVVVDRMTGYPIENVKVEIFKRNYDHRTRSENLDLIYTGYTDKRGINILDISSETRRHNFHIKLTKDDDSLMEHDVYNYMTVEDRKNRRQTYLWFTDRSIYRPGQTIHFKGIALNIDEDGIPSVAANKSTKVRLKDANGQDIETVDILTDDYGSISGTFIIPTSGLNGNFSLGTDDPYIYRYVKVEDYKRPKFLPTFDKSKEEYKLGDTIELSALAKTYAGINLGGAKYKYSVYRQSYYPWYRSFYWCGYNPLPNSARTLLMRSEGIVDEDGNIKIQFQASTDPSMEGQTILPNYHFTIQLDVTDIDGETRSATKKVSVGAKEYLLDVKHPTHLLKGESAELDIKTTNFDGEKITKKGEVLISKLDNVKSIFKEKIWAYPEFHTLDKSSYERIFPLELYKIEDHPFQQKSDRVIERLLFNSSDTLKVVFPELASGLYLVQVSIEGEIQNQTSYIQVFDKVIHGEADFKLLGGEAEYLKGDKVTFNCYSSYKDAKLFYRIYKKNDILRYDWMDNGKEITELIDEDSYGNMKFCTFYVKNNRYYTQSQIVRVPWKHKELDIEYSSFRDHVLPGAEEEFTIKIKGGAQSKNQLTLAMYDASLDVFSKNRWNTYAYPNYQHYSSASYFSFGITNGRLMSKYQHQNFDQSQHLFFPYLLSIDRGRGIGLNFPTRAVAMSARGGNMKSKSYAVDGVAVTESATMMADDAVQMESNSMDLDITAGAINEIESNDKNVVASAPPIRENLNETLFFYPDLETNEEGELSYTFTMNEAITEWKLLSFAHNKKMQFGQDERTLVTKKDLLIQANMPRFLRAGDETLFTAKISNLSEGQLAGEAYIEIINAITQESVLDELMINETKVFDLSKGGSDVVEWKLIIPEDFIMPVIIKVYAIAGNHSDGEQNMLPVLTNRKLVTTTRSMMVRPNSTKEFDFKHLLENLDDESIQSHEYQIEFTTNPVWFAIKAMPYLSVQHNNCTTSYADHLFGNSLAAKIMDENPMIKLIFGQWANDPEALKSELEKNQELKEALLAETPWVRQAQSEAQQRRDIALLFDVNKLANGFISSVSILSNRQSVNGGFSWTAGGRDNRYTTQYVVEQLLKLKRLTQLENNEVDRMISKAMTYLDKRVMEDFKKWERLSQRGSNLPYLIVHYSYLSSMYNGQLFGEIGVAAKTYYKSSFKKHWMDLSPYGQAMIGLSHMRSDKDDLSMLILESLQETVIRNPELGAYWKNNNGYNWYNLGIEQQSLLIEYFEESTVNQELVDELKMWLLTKKQTTHWPTSKSTTAAIYALVNNDEDKLTGSSKIDLWFGHDKQEIKGQEAGSGYFEIQHKGVNINKDFGKIKVNNPNAHIVWGAAYWQYWNDLDKIESAEENPFTIIKEVFLQEQTEEGNKLKSVSNSDSLVQGDKLIVRVELRTDRDLDYVHMRDMRAAGLEPINTMSQYKYQDGLSYYESTRDRYTDFFFERIKRGTYVFEYEVVVTHRGSYSNGITIAQCLYAPSFSGHSEGIRIGFN